LGSWWADIAGGAKYVFSERRLRAIALVNIPLSVLHKLFHALVAVVFAAQVLHNPAWAAVMLGAWNIGELAGAAYLERRGRSSRLSNWMRLGAVASLGVWTFWLLPSAWAAAIASFSSRPAPSLSPASARISDLTQKLLKSGRAAMDRSIHERASSGWIFFETA